MSFSSKVKEELAEQIPAARHCMLAELAAITAICGRTETDETGEKIVHIHTENVAVARKYFTLILSSILPPLCNIYPLFF